MFTALHFSGLDMNLSYFGGFISIYSHYNFFFLFLLTMSLGLGGSQLENTFLIVEEIN